jgi:hypothetical protein
MYFNCFKFLENNIEKWFKRDMGVSFSYISLFVLIDGQMLTTGKSGNWEHLLSDAT